MNPPDLDIVLRTIRLLNKGLSLSDVSRQLSISLPKLSGILQRSLKKGILSVHMIPPLGLEELRVTLAILRSFQKVNTPCLKAVLRTVIKYYSYGNHISEIYLLDEEPSRVEEHVDSSICKIEFVDQVQSVLIRTHSDHESSDHELAEVQVDEELCMDLDEIDRIILFELFRLYNPPLNSNLSKYKALIDFIKRRTGLPGIRGHFYKHIRRCLRRVYAYRNNGDFLLIQVYASSKANLKELIFELNQSGFIYDVWQILLFSKAPVIAMIYAWGSIEKFIDPASSHKKIENVVYNVYPILGVEY